MRKPHFVLGLTLGAVLSLCGPGLAQAPPTLDLRTIADWVIVVDEQAIESERTAADELRRFLKSATGHDLPIRQAANDRHNIYVGPGAALRASALGALTRRTYEPEELAIVIHPDDEQGGAEIAISGGRPRGVLYGVYQFLEDALGIRFLTADHTHVPALGAADVSPGAGILRAADYAYRPRVDFRLVYYTDVMADPLFSAKLRLNSTAPGFAAELADRAAMVGGYVDPGRAMFLHSLNQWAEGVDAEADPAVLALWQGQRIRPYCMSHPDVMAAVTRNVLHAAAQAPEGAILRVAQEDAPWCECARCQALWAEHGGSKSAVPIRLVNRVAREVARTRPDITIGTLAYAWSRQPPADMSLEPNVRIQYCTYHGCVKDGYGDLACPTNLGTWQDIRQWRALGADLVFWHYTVNFADYLQPPVNIESIGPQIRALAGSGRTGIFLQGPGSGVNLPFADMMISVMAHLLWNPDQDPMRLFGEFVDLHYGRAAPPIHAFLDLTRRCVRDHPEHSNCNGHIAEFGLTPAAGDAGIALFEQARQLADDDLVRARVEKASVGAYRMAIGGHWYGREPVPEPERLRVRALARTLFELTARHRVAEHSEGAPMSQAEGRLRRALGMAEGEAF